MAKDKANAAQDPGAGSVLQPAEYRFVGLDPDTREVFVPQVPRSYVLDEMTPAQKELAYRLGWPHIEKI